MCVYWNSRQINFDERFSMKAKWKPTLEKSLLVRVEKWMGNPFTSFDKLNCSGQQVWKHCSESMAVSTQYQAPFDQNNLASTWLRILWHSSIFHCALTTSQLSMQCNEYISILVYGSVSLKRQLSHLQVKFILRIHSYQKRWSSSTAADRVERLAMVMDI